VLFRSLLTRMGRVFAVYSIAGVVNTNSRNYLKQVVLGHK